jgi:hypothetical protein
MSENNITNISSRQANKIIEQGINDLDKWYDSLIENDVDVITILGLLEVVKHSVLQEMIEGIEYD